MTAAPNPLPPTQLTGYHPPGCWREPGHHGCAIAVLDRLACSEAVVVEDTTAVHPNEPSGTVAEFVDYLAAHDVIPDVPQPSLPMTRTRRQDGALITEVV